MSCVEPPTSLEDLRELASLALLSAAALGAAGAGTALAGPGTHPASPAGTSAAPLASAPTVLPAGVPRGYLSLQGPLLSAPAGVQTRGTLACPGRKVPLGGGVFISSSDLAVNVNSSFPNQFSWIADVNNASGGSTTFRLFVICGRAPRLYQVVQTQDATANPNAQRSAQAQCPAGTVPLGGGALSRSGELTVNVNSTFPAGTAWRADLNNATNAESAFTVLAVCAKKPAGWTVATAGNVTIGPGLSTRVEAVCPGAGLPLGGGVVSFTNDVHANVNSTFPASGDAWDAFVSNASGGLFAASARVVCAGV